MTIVKYRPRADAVIEADSQGDALRRIGEHFLAWAEDTLSDDPDTWVADASLTAPQFAAQPGSYVHVMPEE